MDVVWPAVFAAFGLVFGSFLNVVVYRLPRGMSVVAPPSSCPRCGAPIAPRDNVPILSFLALRGRCRVCHEPIAAEYPIVEGVTAALFATTAVVLSVGRASLLAPFLGVMVAVALIDARHRIIPNRLIYPSLAVLAAAVLGAWALGVEVSPVRAGLGLVAYGGGLMVVALVSPEGMGMGDVKLAALIGMVLGALGWRYLVVAVVVGVFLGGAGAIVALLSGRGRRETIPFGPFLAVGAVVSALLAGPIATWYGGLA